MTPEQTACLEAAFDSISRYDDGRFAGLLSDDAVIEGPTTIYHGPLGARALVAELARQYTAFVVRPTRIIADGNSAAAEFVADVTGFGGSRHRANGCLVAELSGDRIVRCRFYWRPEDLNA